MKCFYHNDMDGRCAGSIVNKYWLKAGKKLEDIYKTTKFIEVDYKDEIDVNSIETEENIIIVDFSFKPEVMEKVLKKTNRIIWIDHHKTADEYKYSQEIGGLRITKDKEFSGCELTWKYFYPDEEMPRSVKLIGDRDKWAWKMGEDTALFNLGLKLYPHQPWDKIWNELLSNSDKLYKIVMQGVTCVEFRDNFCKDYADSYGFETEFEGYKCFALGLYMFGSEAFGERFKKYDICLSFEFTGNNWIIGLYSEKVDVGVIAKKYGGGGHTGAAGFVCDTLPFKREIDNGNGK